MNSALKRKLMDYGPLETENVRVGTVDAESPEAREDDHGLAAMRKRKRGGKVEGKKPRARLDRPARKHPDEAQDRKLIRAMVKPEDLKRPERANGGSVKGKKGTTVNVIIAGGGAKPGMPMPPPSGPMPVPPPVMARPPMAGPPMPPAGVPMPPPGAMPPGAGMMRRDGGRVGKYPIKDGAGSGLGREEKVRAYGKMAREGERK